MNWEAIGAIGETLGAIGVIVTLVYLASQLRQNTNALRAASIDSTIKLGNDVRQSMYGDPDMTAIYFNGLTDVDSLTELERERFRLIMTNSLWALWNAYAQSLLGGRQSWAAQKYILRRVLTQPGGAWFWDTYRGEFDHDFQLEVDRVLAADS